MKRIVGRTFDLSFLTVYGCGEQYFDMMSEISKFPLSLSAEIQYCCSAVKLGTHSPSETEVGDAARLDADHITLLSGNRERKLCSLNTIFP